MSRASSRSKNFGRVGHDLKQRCFGDASYPQFQPRPNRKSCPVRLLIVGNPLEFHLGSHLLDAAKELNWDVRIEDLRDAWSSSRWVNRIYRRLFRKLPSRMKAFGDRVVATCREFQPQLMISTGVAPLSASTLREIGKLGVFRVNYLTDDPWSPSNKAGFFFQSLPEYDLVANPRRANIDDLLRLGCRRVDYIPFGYNPAYHFIELNPTADELSRFRCDVAIIGGADEDRVPLAQALVNDGLNLALYGTYWDSYPSLKKYHRGYAHGRDLRLAVQLANSNVCMVRRANRDGHAMRSLEFPAMRGCLVAEDTVEHRDLYGADGESVLYWNDEASLVKVTRQLSENASQREKLTQELVHRIVDSGVHSYAHRLREIAATVPAKS